MYHPKTTKALPRPSKATPFARRQPPSLPRSSSSYHLSLSDLGEERVRSPLPFARCVISIRELRVLIRSLWAWI
ncbi:unnamed protein product, partial [Musa banksii]